MRFMTLIAFAMLSLAGCAGRATLSRGAYYDDYYVESAPRYQPYGYYDRGYYNRYDYPRRHVYVQPPPRVIVRPRAPQVYVRPPHMMPHHGPFPHHRHFPG